MSYPIDTTELKNAAFVTCLLARRWIRVIDKAFTGMDQEEEDSEWKKMKDMVTTLEKWAESIEGIASKRSDLK